MLAGNVTARGHDRQKTMAMTGKDSRPDIRTLLLSLALRYGILLVGLVFALGSHAAWTTGDPPPSSLFIGTTAAVVVRAEVEAGLASNGSLRHLPRVDIRWPETTGPAIGLRGLLPSFYGDRRADAERVLVGFVPGETVPVRIIDGHPYTDRIDWFRLLGALWLSLIAGILLVLGLVVIRLSRPASAQKKQQHAPPSR